MGIQPLRPCGEFYRAGAIANRPTIQQNWACRPTRFPGIPSYWQGFEPIGRNEEVSRYDFTRKIPSKQNLCALKHFPQGQSSMLHHPSKTVRSSFSLILSVGLLCAGAQIPQTWSQSDLPRNPGPAGTNAFGVNPSPTSSLPPLPDRTLAEPGFSDGLQSPLQNQYVGNNPEPIHSALNTPSPNHAGQRFLGGPTCSSNATHLMSSVTLSNGFQQIVLVDPAKQTMAVYHIDPSRGEIQLKSVRKIDADFSIEEFNATEPTPTAIRRNTRLQPAR